LIAAGVIAAAGAVYSGYAANKAGKEAVNALNQRETLDLERIPNPETVDWQDILRQTTATNYNNLPLNLATANRVNEFNTNQFLRGANKIQPYFNQLQEQIGRNALSYSRGELPGDVVSSLSRGAASQGFKNGIAGGARGGGFNTALGGLNLRNLGLTSLDLSKFGTGLGMQANQNAGNMVPNLFDPASQMISPQLGIGSAFNNAGIINDWNRANTQIANAEETGNTELLNSILEAQTGGQLNQAQSIQSASSSIAGIGSQYASMGGGGMGGGGGGNSFAGAQAGSQMGSTNRYLI
jgi:hypothetical protein